MPNIMLTYRCNLHCSYCFANEFVNKADTDITIRNFLKAVSFVTRTGKARIGLIGGEPTLHPGFKAIMELLISNSNVESVTVFTNGLLLDRFVPQLAHPKVRFLVNCNSPLIIGENAFLRMKQNLDLLMLDNNTNGRGALGINLYSDDMDYSYIVELLQRYKQHYVRISLTVPDFSTCGNIDVLGYFKRRKHFLLDFFRKMDSIQVLPAYDCNRPPYCIWTDEEKKWLESYVARYPQIDTDIIGNRSVCYPVIDILPNLQAVRCFGMSDFMKVSIDDFKNIHDMKQFFINEIDSYAFKLSACKECNGCYEQKVSHCITGCMGFKASRIRSSKEAIEHL